MPISGRYVVRSTIGLLTVGLLALLAIVGTTIWLNERAQVHFNEVIEAREIRSAAVELRNALHASESSQRGFLITGNEIYLAPYDTSKLVATQRLESLKKSLAQFSTAEAVLQRLNTVIIEKIREMDDSIQLKRDRREQEVLEIINTNRGKALMDEANVFLSGITQVAEDRLSNGVAEQRANANWLRWVSILGAILIALVVAGVVLTFGRYAREIAQARDEVRTLNAGLEQRVQQRTADLARARDRAEVLVAEVNHRVANSLSLVASLVKLQSRAVTDASAKDALGETEARIYAISSVHKKLYSSGDVRFVDLNEYLSGILDHLEKSMREEGSGASLRYDLEPVKLPTDTSINLGVVVTELVTNAFKYAYPNKPGEVRVRLRSLPEKQVELVVEDDGIGRGEQVAKGTGLGTRIVGAMAATMGAEFNYTGRDPGTTARLTFPLQPEMTLQ